MSRETKSLFRAIKLLYNFSHLHYTEDQIYIFKEVVAAQESFGVRSPCEDEEYRVQLLLLPKMQPELQFKPAPQDRIPADSFLWDGKILSDTESFLLIEIICCAKS